MTTETQQPDAVATPEPLVLSRRDGVATRITLNRPRAINALNDEMYTGLSAAFTAAIADANTTVIVLDGAGERGFCGGGDIKELTAGLDRQGGAATADILAREYRLDHLVATSPTPVVSFMDGVTMGGGIGLGGHASHRIVTERSRLAMPEARIGISPDVGGHLLLARSPGRLGEFLAVTAGEMSAGDAIAFGFADYFVPSERLEALGQALAEGQAPTEACAEFAQASPASALLNIRAWWDPLAESALGADRPEPESDPGGAALRLTRSLEASDLPAARAAAATIRSMCPTSVAVTLALIDRTRRRCLSLAEVLEDDLRVLRRLAPRPDFMEGVRAQVIDKDRNPRWSPAKIEHLDPAALSSILAPREPGDPRVFTH